MPCLVKGVSPSALCFKASIYHIVHINIILYDMLGLYDVIREIHFFKYTKVVMLFT